MVKKLHDTRGLALARRRRRCALQQISVYRPLYLPCEQVLHNPPKNQQDMGIGFNLFKQGR